MKYIAIIFLLSLAAFGQTGGTLTGSLSTPSGTAQLTTEGSLDWVHWGMTAVTDVTRKAGVLPSISDYRLIGGVPPIVYSNNPLPFSWTDGAPTVTGTNVTSGLFVGGLDNGFQLTVPADTSVKTFKVYVGTWHTQGKLVAHLSDSSAPDYIDTSFANTVNPTSDGAYTLNYKAATAGQTLTVTFTLIGDPLGNVTLQAATLTGAAAPPPPAVPTVSLSTTMTTVRPGDVVTVDVVLTGNSQTPSGASGFDFSLTPAGSTGTSMVTSKVLKCAGSRCILVSDIGSPNNTVITNGTIARAQFTMPSTAVTYSIGNVHAVSTTGNEIVPAVTPNLLLTPIAPLSACDLNKDGVVNTSDMTLFLAKFFDESTGVSACGAADINGNGTCDSIDYQRLSIAVMGGSCVVGK